MKKIGQQNGSKRISPFSRDHGFRPVAAIVYSLEVFVIWTGDVLRLKTAQRGYIVSRRVKVRNY